jgi:hypothetical protein
MISLLFSHNPQQLHHFLSLLHFSLLCLLLLQNGYAQCNALINVSKQTESYHINYRMIASKILFLIVRNLQPLDCKTLTTLVNAYDNASYLAVSSLLNFLELLLKLTNN